MVIRETWFARVLRSAGLLPSVESDHMAGADYSAAHPAQHSFSVPASMSAYAAFPWVQAATRSISDALSSVPIRISTGRGVDSERVDDHPLLELLDQPSSRVAGSLFRRQIITDMVLSGNAYVLIVGDREPTGLLRLHPERTKAVPWADGQVSHYEYDGGKKVEYAYERVLHFRSTSWGSDPSGSLYGVSAIQALSNDLNADLQASRNASRTAERGRPSGIFSPATDDIWSPQQVRIMREAYDRQLTGRSDALFLGSNVSYTPISLSPRDMEFQAQRKWVRESTLAVFGCPPVMVGLPTANYATSKEQRITFWENIKHHAAILNSELTRLARMWGDPSVRVWHDFSEVEALAENRTEQLNRVSMWWTMGLTLRQASEMEGLDLPQNIVDQPAPESETPEPVAESGIRQLFIGEGDTYTPPTTEADRQRLWRGFIDNAHSPRERALGLTVRRELRARAKRTGERLAEMFPIEKYMGTTIKRTLADADWEQLIASLAEMSSLSSAVQKDMQKTVAAGFREAVKMLPLERLSFDPAVRDLAVEKSIEHMTTITEPENIERIKAVINKGLTEGLSIGEMQEALMTDRAFTASRALRIARTETTRAANAGSLVAYKDAVGLGVEMKVEWLTARDDAVRASHRPMDGKRVLVGQDFTLGSGAHGPSPGQIEVAAEDINCRCTIVPFVEGISEDIPK